MKRIETFILMALFILFLSPEFLSASGGFTSGGGGFGFGWLSADFSDINSEIALMGLNPVDEGVGLFGFEGFGYISDNVRVGVRFAGGGNRTSGVIPAVLDVNLQELVLELVKEAVVSSGVSGLTIEYTREVPYGIQMIAGGMIGFGNVSVKISQFETPLTWTGIWDEYQTGVGGYNLTMEASNSLFVLNPWIGAEYKLLRWMGVCVKAGYVFSTSESGDWKVNNREIFGGPKVGMSSLNFEFSVIFGK